MRIGDLSRKTGVSVRMLRFYEAEGLLAPTRSAKGYREFTSADVDTVERIRLLGSAGMTLPVIRDFLPCSLEKRHQFEPCDELKATLRKQLDLLDERRRKLLDSRNLVVSLLQTFEVSTHSRP